MTPEETLDWLAQQHFDQCREERPIQDWIRKMKSQLPKQEQGEPVAYVVTTEVHGQMCSFIHRSDLTKLLPDGQLLYTTPQQRTWVALTDEEREQVYKIWRFHPSNETNLHLCKAIEAKLKEKNT